MATLDELKRDLIDAHRTGDFLRAKQLALSVKLMESQPMGAVPVAQPLGYKPARIRQPLTIGQRVQEFGAGVGRGLETQLEGVRAIGERFSQLQQESAQQPGSPLQAMVFRPAAQLGREFVAGLEPFVRDPGKIVEAGQEMAARAASGPQQAGQVFGEMVDPRVLLSGLKTPPVAELTTYHGTPHVFAPEEGAPLGRFRASQIGTGEGAQAFGHGIYVAESPDVAKQYAITRGVPDLERMSTERGLNLSRDARVELMRQSKTDKDAISAARMLQNASRETRGLPIEKLADTIDAYRQAQKAQLYTVDLPDPMIERMLDWDKPLRDQPKEVRQALTRLAQNAAQSDEQLMKDFQRLGASAPANQLYAALVQRAVRLKKYEGMRAGIPEDKAIPSLSYGQQIASEQLRQAGIPGIRYLDAGSRDSAKGTRNFVIFPGEEQNLTILKRE